MQRAHQAANGGTQATPHPVPDDSRAVVAFQVSDMTCARCASAITKALKAVDHAALVRVDLETFTVEIESNRANARQLSDAINQAGYSPVAA